MSALALALVLALAAAAWAAVLHQSPEVVILPTVVVDIPEPLAQPPATSAVVLTTSHATARPRL